MASEKISIVLVSGSRERLQMAAMMASVGAVSGYEVSVFVSMNALPHFTRDARGVAESEGPMGLLLEEKKAPPFHDLFQQAVELGDAQVYPCSMAMDILGLDREMLAVFVAEPLGLTRFLSDTNGGQCWTF